MPNQSAGAIEEIVSRFINQLRTALQDEAVVHARATVLAAIGARASGGASLPITAGRLATSAAPIAPGRPPGKPRKSPPIQYCPVPGCTNRAAPVFGMVCAKHKDLPKAKIKKYREERRAEKAKAA